jgi:hypothetical protein
VDKFFTFRCFFPFLCDHFPLFIEYIMYWTLELATYLEDAPWPATKEELIDFAQRSGAPLEVTENLEDLPEDGMAI